MTDRQHPHDLVSQASVAWTVPIRGSASLTVAGAPVGEASLGPVVFMHRASSADNPTAPLTHHLFDSTHMVTSVVAARLDAGHLSFEGSAFHGREPDEHRYDVDVGKPDSWSARVWVRPLTGVAVQVSHGFLHEPERLEPGDQRRTNASVGFWRSGGETSTGVTLALGRNKRQYSSVSGFLAEATHTRRRFTAYARAERLEVETEILLFPFVLHKPHAGELVDTVGVISAGAVVDVFSRRGVVVGIGGDAANYALPPLLQVTHGDRPWSFHLFFRVARNRESRMRDMVMLSHATQSHVE